VQQINNFDPNALSRPELGVHYNFENIVPVLKNYSDYLKTIVSFQTPLLTGDEITLIENSIRKLLDLQTRIRNFNPKEGDDAQTYKDLLEEINSSWRKTSKNLRTIYNFVKVNSIELTEATKTVEEVVNKAKSTNDYIDKKKNEIKNLSNKQGPV
ncbi:MAG: hypothetical protein ACE5F2_02830, partial [Candidatus Paceibacteria bacterium]